ncbi:MAG: MBL fold metallo-hydrolase [Bacteroidia bacterium]
MQIKAFTLNPFQENTYIIFDETKECIIVDPGCSNASEKKILSDYIEKEKLNPVKLINTHCHIDHVLGNKFVSEKYKIGLEIHSNELEILHSLERVGQMYGVETEPSPEPIQLLTESEKIIFGNTSLDILFTPGHSPGSISFYNKAKKILISGDVLFYGSIGRTDLPGGNYETLIESIKTKLLILEDDITVYSGHGKPTTIGFERMNNPFLV